MEKSKIDLIYLDDETQISGNNIIIILVSSQTHIISHHPLTHLYPCIALLGYISQTLRTKAQEEIIDSS